MGKIFIVTGLTWDIPSHSLYQLGSKNCAFFFVNGLNRVNPNIFM